VYGAASPDEARQPETADADMLRVFPGEQGDGRILD
jgi:hypothetical protein